MCFLEQSFAAYAVSELSIFFAEFPLQISLGLAMKFWRFGVSLLPRSITNDRGFCWKLNPIFLVVEFDWWNLSFKALDQP